MNGVEAKLNKVADQIATEGMIIRASEVRSGAAEIKRLLWKLDRIARHPDTPALIKAYARGDLDGESVDSET